MTTTGEPLVPVAHGAFRFIVWALIAASTNLALGSASILTADRLPDGLARSTLWLGGLIVSFAIGLVLLDRGYRRKAAPVTPMYITGVGCYLLVLAFLFFRVLLFAIGARGQLDL